MKRLIMIFFVIAIAMTTFSCSEQEVAPMQELPEAEYTDGDDDDEDCGQVGGGCPSSGS